MHGMRLIGMSTQPIQTIYSEWRELALHVVTPGQHTWQWMCMWGV